MPALIKKAAIILLLLLFTALVGGYLYLSSSSFRELARTQAMEWFEGRFRGRLQMEQLDWNPLSNKVVIRGLRIDAPESSDDRPAVQAREVTVNFSLGSYFSRFDLQEVLLDGLQVRVLREPDGRINLARTFERPNQVPEPDQPDKPDPDIQPFLRLAIDRIQATDSQIYYFDQPISLDSFEGNLRFELLLQAASGTYRGDLEMRSMQFAISGTRLPPLDLQTQFILERTRIQLQRLALNAPWIDGQFSGVVDGYVTLDHQVSVQMELDTASVSEAFALRLPIAGRVNITGTARGRKGAYGLSGEVRGESIQVAQISVGSPEAQFRLDNEGVDLSGFQGIFENVPFLGQGQIWWKADRESTVQVRTGAAHRHVLARVVEPYAHILPGGQAQGTIRFPGVSFSEWKGTGTFRLPGQLGQRPGFETGPPLLFRSGWQGDSNGLLFDSCTIELEQTRIDCVGTVAGRDRFSFEVDYTVDSSSSVVAWGKTWIPFPGPDVAGGIRGQGALRLEPGLPLDWQSKTAIDELIFENISMGAVTVDVNRGSDETWNTMLEFSNQSPVQGTLEATLDSEELPVRTVRAQISGDLGPLMDRELGWSESRAPARIEASLSRLGSVLNGTANLEGQNWSVLGQEFDSVAGSVELQDQNLLVREFQARIPGDGQVLGSGAIDLSARSHQLTVTGSQIDLSQIMVLPETAGLRGLAEISATSSGTQWPPTFSAEVQINGLQVAEISLGDLSARIDHVEGTGEAELAGDLEFRDQQFSFSGDVGLTAPYGYNLHTELADLPPGLILETFLADKVERLPELDGLITGVVTASGELAVPKIDLVEARLDDFRLRVADLELRNRRPILLNLQENRLTLQLVTFEGSGSSFTLQGNILFADDPELNVRAQGTARLDLLNPFLSGITTQGPADIQLILVGTVSEPRLVGEVELRNGSIQHPALPQSLNAVETRLRFTADQISVEAFRATTTYGAFEANGGIFLDGLTPSRWFLNITGQDLHLEYPDKVFSVADVDLDLTKGEGNPLLSGVVHVRSASYEEQLSLSDLFFRYSQGTAVQTRSATSQELDLNIALNAYRAIRIENNLAEIYASGDLQIRGTSSNPVLQGSLVVDQGRLFLERNEYRLIRGGVSFNDPRRTRPILNFDAETEVQDYTIGIQVSGPADRMNINFRSDPPLPTPNIVSLLALGQLGEGLFQGGGGERAGSLAVYGVGALLNQSLSRRLQSQGNRLFGLDRITIDPFITGSERNPGARVTLGKHLGNRLSVTYSTDLGSESQGQIVVIQWKFTDWLTVVGTGEQNGALAIDFKLRRRF